MASDKIMALKARVEADAYDAGAWEQLLGEISRGRKSPEQSAQLRATYEDLLAKFPTAVRHRRRAPHRRPRCRPLSTAARSPLRRSAARRPCRPPTGRSMRSWRSTPAAPRPPRPCSAAACSPAWTWTSGAPTCASSAASPTRAAPRAWPRCARPTSSRWTTWGRTCGRAPCGRTTSTSWRPQSPAAPSTPRCLAAAPRGRATPSARWPCAAPFTAP
jgi:hypothetical protein